MTKDTLVIYHGNCADGFTSAWVARKYFKEQNKIDEVEFYEARHNTLPPDCTGLKVFILDFAYGLSGMQKIIEEADHVVHIDHHAPMLAALSNLSMFMTTVYNMDKTASGAMLAWQYFFPDELPPDIVRYVDDRDRYVNVLPNTREYSQYVFSQNQDFGTWDKMSDMPYCDIVSAGTIMLEKHNHDIGILKKIVVRRLNIGGYNVPVANVPPLFGSDIAADLMEGEPFAAFYYDTANSRTFGLRGNGRVDVSKIARRFGGGGHDDSAAFRISRQEAEDFEL